MSNDNGQPALASAAIENLFVPLDGTESHEQAIGLGLLFNDWFGARLHLFFSLADLPPLINMGVWRQRAQISAAYAEPTPTPQVDGNDPLLHNGALYEYGKMMAHSYLDEIRHHLEHLDIEITTDVAAGSPAHILTYKAQSVGNAIVVMQAQPQSGWRRFIARNTSENLLTTTTVPVLMHSGDFNVNDPYQDYAPSEIILPLRRAPAMHAALPYVVAIAEKTNASVKIVVANDSGPVDHDERQALVDQTAAQLEQTHVEVKAEQLDLSLESAVARVYAYSDNPWVVIGSRMRRGLAKHLMASRVDNVRRIIDCPLLAVPVAQILKKRQAAVDRWLVEWRADPGSMDSDDQRWWNRRSMQRSVTDALTRIRGSRNGEHKDDDQEDDAAGGKPKG